MRDLLLMKSPECVRPMAATRAALTVMWALNALHLRGVQRVHVADAIVDAGGAA
ncbi:hypothetical protein [Roseateles amylovorans]|uniref:Uncharacterized protein n=1 Tax=Roseateles amylovorans TaxID=2978473 RepID=A0ABY6B2W5_9BURK|nr:hypothetical protein [Roseateles amylovorans]UXH79263.1 hypothetical protein N4261_04830 [Roseateles amylovorans]